MYQNVVGVQDVYRSLSFAFIDADLHVFPFHHRFADFGKFCHCTVGAVCHVDLYRAKYQATGLGNVVVLITVLIQVVLLECVLR